MKASELIGSLKDMISKYGDLELVTQVEDAYDEYKASFGDVEAVSFDAGRICICGKSTSIVEWIDEWKNSFITGTSDYYPTVTDHFSAFRSIESEKEYTGYANYDGREF